MKVAYFDCSGGISGIAGLAALIDAGADIDSLSKELALLGGKGPVLAAEDVVVGEFRARRVTVEEGARSVATRSSDLETLLAAAELPDDAREMALAVYRRLAGAEARVHGSSPDRVRFHEVGSLRSVVGVVGVTLALGHLGIDEVAASPVPYGRGTVDTEHGRLVVPTPATLELLRGVPVAPQQGSGELVTPTGAAILATAASTFGDIPAMTIESIGYGTGDRRTAPIVLRVVIGNR
jgi:pyridinium-3,5-bisthiocarboxylic acid mononucleotide nickel chelatase